MDPTRVLVVYYSRTDTTRTVAQAIRNELGCEIERISDTKHRAGILGYLRSGFDAVWHRAAALRPMSTDPKEYDLVIVGTPVWNASVSAPVRTYLRKNRGRIRRVAFFCTYGGMGSARALRQMKRLCGRKPVTTLALRMDDVQHGAISADVRSFVTALEASSVAEEIGRRARFRVVPA